MCQTFFPTAISFSRKITDARGRSVAWVYYRREGALGAEYLTRDQAVEMAKSAVMVNQPLTARRYGRQSRMLPALSWADHHLHARPGNAGRTAAPRQTVQDCSPMSDQWMTYQQLAQLWEMSPLGALNIIDSVTMALLIGGAYAKVRSLEKAGGGFRF